MKYKAIISDKDPFEDDWQQPDVAVIVYEDLSKDEVMQLLEVSVSQGHTVAVSKQPEYVN